MEDADRKALRAIIERYEREPILRDTDGTRVDEDGYELDWVDMVHAMEDSHGSLIHDLEQLAADPPTPKVVLSYDDGIKEPPTGVHLPCTVDGCGGHITSCMWPDDMFASDVMFNGDADGVTASINGRRGDGSGETLWFCGSCFAEHLLPEDIEENYG